jgi:hypothetical protein
LTEGEETVKMMISLRSGGAGGLRVIGDRSELKGIYLDKAQKD